MGEMKFLRFLTSNLSQSYVIFLDNLSFILGNIILYSLFSIYIDFNTSINLFDNVINIDILVFIAISVISFVIVGKNIIYWKSFFWLLIVSLLFMLGLSPIFILVGIILFIAIPIICLFKYYRKPERKEKLKSSIPENNNRLRIIFMSIIVFPRLLFFNISHFLFPLLFIWISLLGVIYFLFSLTINNFNNFVGLVTLIGIIFGFFQYYVKGYKENVQKKLVQYFTKLSLPEDIFTLKDFKSFLKPRTAYNNVENAILQVEDDFSSKSSPSVRIGIEKFLSNMNLSQSDVQVFKSLEKEMELKGNKGNLIKAYKEFFEEKKIEFKTRIDKKKIKELMWLLMGNINILGETLVTLGTLDLPDKEPESYDEFFKQASYEILNEVITSFIFE